LKKYVPEMSLRSNASETKFLHEDKGHAVKEYEKEENKRHPAVQGECSTAGQKKM